VASSRYSIACATGAHAPLAVNATANVTIVLFIDELPRVRASATARPLW
jgi:hypothetical protein